MPEGLKAVLVAIGVYAVCLVASFVVIAVGGGLGGHVPIRRIGPAVVLTEVAVLAVWAAGAGAFVWIGRRMVADRALRIALGVGYSVVAALGWLFFAVFVLLAFNR